MLLLGTFASFLFRWSNFYSLNHWVPLWTNTTMDNMEHFSSPDSQWMTVRMTLHLSITVHTTDFSNLSGLSCWLRHEAAISTHPEEWIPYQSKNERNQGCWIKVESSIPCHVPMCCSPFSPTYLKYSCVMLTSAVWMQHRAEAWLNWIIPSVSQHWCMECCPDIFETPAWVPATWFGEEADLHSLRDPMDWLQNRWTTS